mmetsp:Transcript_3025/g.7974  ORF Transcript_3025/g.7974 Transcript_3025/m.7974 type:complete len:376 (+) Transcript_3025:47-1174(+)
MLRKLSVVVCAVAVTIGAQSKINPNLFFKIPHVGFILWALTGHPMPPFLTRDMWKDGEHQTWLRDGDLIVSVAAKSGTTWMLYCSHQVRTKGSDDIDFVDVMWSTPWPEMRQDPAHTWALEKELMNTTVVPNGKLLREYWDNPRFPFRIFKSHENPREFGGSLPIRARPGVKFLAMVRNHLDQIASLVPFFNQHTDEFRALWGGFPPASSGDPVKDAEARLQDALPGGNLGHYFTPYVRSWWAMRHEPNVLLLHYADAVADLEGTVRAIADFVGVELTDAERANVVRKCGMEHMKAHPQYFGYSAPLNPRVPADFRVVRSGSMTRTGGTGTGKAALTPEQQARWRAVEEAEYTDPALLKWAREGGGAVGSFGDGE